MPPILELRLRAFGHRIDRSPTETHRGGHVRTDFAALFCAGVIVLIAFAGTTGRT
jgi:hypothetical protein